MENRIKNYAEARSVIADLEEQDVERAQARSKVEGQIAGNLPYDPQQLKALGQGYRSNINFLELDGNTKSRLSSFVRLLFDTPTIATVVMVQDDVPVNKRVYYCDIIADEFTKMIKRKWKGFYIQFAKAMRNMVVHGVGVLYWPTRRSFKFKSSMPGGIHFSHMTSEDADMYDIVEIVDDMPIDRLFDLIKSVSQSAASEKLGWNVKIIHSILAGCAKKDALDGFGGPPQTDEEFAMLQMKRSSFQSIDSAPRSIKISHLYSREETGKVTHAMVVDDESIFDNKDAGEERYLYYNEEEYDTFEEFVVPLLCDIGNDGIHAIRGYGHKIYAHCVVSNRMLNSTNDSAILGSTLLIKSPTSGERSMNDVIRIGPITVLPSDCDVVTGGISASNEGLIRARALLAANLANNFGNERPTNEGTLPNNSYKTARQTDAEMIKSKSITNVETLIFYLFADQVLENLFSRVFDKALTSDDAAAFEKFKKRCLSRGVPTELFTSDILYAQATRVIGFGSQEMQLGITRDMITIAPYLKEDGKQQTVRDYALARVGADNLDRYCPEMNTDLITRFSHQIALLENNDMLLGRPAIVSADDDHPFHLDEHMKNALETIGAFAKQESPFSPQEMLAFVGQVTSHIMQHISFLQGAIYEQLVKETVTNLQQIQNFYQKLQGMAKQQQAQEQQQQQQQQEILSQAAEMLKGSDQGLKLEKIRGDLQIKAQKEQENMRLRETKQAHTQMLAEALTTARIQSMDRETAAKVRSNGG